MGYERTCGYEVKRYATAGGTEFTVTLREKTYNFDGSTKEDVYTVTVGAEEYAAYCTGTGVYAFVKDRYHHERRPAKIEAVSARREGLLKELVSVQQELRDLRNEDWLHNLEYPPIEQEG
jgi:hypothetical protein